MKRRITGRSELLAVSVGLTWLVACVESSDHGLQTSDADAEVMTSADSDASAPELPNLIRGEKGAHDAASAIVNETSVDAGARPTDNGPDRPQSDCGHETEEPRSNPADPKNASSSDAGPEIAPSRKTDAGQPDTASGAGDMQPVIEPIPSGYLCSEDSEASLVVALKGALNASQDFGNAFACEASGITSITSVGLRMQFSEHQHPVYITLVIEGLGAAASGTFTSQVVLNAAEGGSTGLAWGAFCETEITRNEPLGTVDRLGAELHVVQGTTYCDSPLTHPGEGVDPVELESLLFALPIGF